MKKFILTVFTLLLAFGGFTQTLYWSVYHFEVQPGKETEIVNAFDRFFASEMGKTLPYAALSASMFASSKDRWTHEILFATDSKEDFGKMYSGMLQESTDFALLGLTMDRSMTPVASYLGRSVIAEPIPGNNYANVIELSVDDPGKYVDAFRVFRESVLKMTDGKMGLDLHQFISGNEKDATHAVVATAPTFEQLLDWSDKVYSSGEFASFIAKVKDVRSVLRRFTTFTFKEYNIPGGM